MKILRSSSYNPARGGHAPNDVREAFMEAVDAFADWRDGAPEPTVEVREQDVPISAVCGLLWNCHDALPSLLRSVLEDVGIERCGSYASAARYLKPAIAEQVDRGTPSTT